MKYSKRYIAFTLILALIFVSNFYIYAKDSSTLGAFRGAQIDNTIWSPLVAADVNGTTIRLRIENKEYTSEDEHNGSRVYASRCTKQQCTCIQ